MKHPLRLLFPLRPLPPLLPLISALQLLACCGWAGLAACGSQAEGGGPRRRGPKAGLHAVLPVLPAPSPSSPVPPSTLIEWLPRGGPAERVAVTAGGVAAGPLAGQPAWHPFADPARREELLRLTSTYAAWQERTAEGELAFHGTGSEAASPTDRRMIREWTRLAALEAEEGMRGDFGLVLTWHRGATSGGVCDQVAAYLTGEVVAGHCGASPAGRRSLDAERLRRLYGWYDELAPFQAAELEGGGSQHADAVLERVHFAGRGRRPATHEEAAAIRSLAGALFGELTAPRRPPPPPPAAALSAQAPPARQAPPPSGNEQPAAGSPPPAGSGPPASALPPPAGGKRVPPVPVPPPPARGDQPAPDPPPPAPFARES